MSDENDYKIEAKAYTASSSGAAVSSGERPDEPELYHSKSWWTTYVFSQDAKIYWDSIYLCRNCNCCTGIGAFSADEITNCLS